MPESKIAARGGAVRYRTIKVRGKNGKTTTLRVAIVRKAGPRGGHTIAKKVP